MVDLDRTTRILTPADRRWLWEGELTGDYDNQVKQKQNARRRIRNGLLDLPIVRFLPRGERRKIFEDMQPGDDLYWALTAGVCLAKYACDDAGLPFEELLEEAVELGASTPRPHKSDEVEDSGPTFEDTGRGKILSDVTIEIDYEYEDAFYPKRLRERFLEGDELTNGELCALMRSEEFDQEAFDELHSRRENEYRD